MTIKIVLVVENQTFVTAVCKVLGLLSGTMVIALARNGLEALSEAEQLQPELVLLAFNMPDLNGMEVKRQMQSWRQPPHVIFLSKFDNVDYRNAAHVCGAVDFVSTGALFSDLPPNIERLLPKHWSQPEVSRNTGVNLAKFGGATFRTGIHRSLQSAPFSPPRTTQ